jgi:hypothetical protein
MKGSADPAIGAKTSGRDSGIAGEATFDRFPALLSVFEDQVGGILTGKFSGYLPSTPSTIL